VLYLCVLFVCGGGVIFVCHSTNISIHWQAGQLRRPPHTLHQVYEGLLFFKCRG
jgi:hypothetical protein